MTLISTIDDYGKPAWIALAILGFIIYWPIGLVILLYLFWSGRMGCWNSRDWQRNWRGNETARGHGRFRGFRGLTPTGNAAFDDYREETLRRLENEAEEFRAFLERLRKAKDRAEFEQFMAERKSDGGSGTPTPATPQ